MRITDLMAQIIIVKIGPSGPNWERWDVKMHAPRWHVNGPPEPNLTLPTTASSLNESPNHKLNDTNAHYWPHGSTCSENRVWRSYTAHKCNTKCDLPSLIWTCPEQKAVQTKCWTKRCTMRINIIDLMQKVDEM